MEKLSHSQIVSGPDDRSVDQALRPARWEDYVGQELVKKNLRVIVDAAKQRGEAMDHILFHGQPGLGKTTLAHLVAHEMNSVLKATSGPALEKVGDLVATLSNLEAGETLFIDEIHRLNRTIEEVLYPAMENRKLHLIVGKGPGARILSLDLPPFTLLAATTRADLLSSPLRARFGATFHLSYYESEDIERILRRSAELLSIGIAPEAIPLLAAASRATPRIANRLLRRARDVAQVSHPSARAKRTEITAAIARETLSLLGIDTLGLEQADRRLLDIVIGKFAGGPVGIASLAAALNEERGVIEEVYEPYLLRVGMIRRTSAGRVASDAAYEHLGVPVPSGRTGGLL
ncbi:MAG: Holliday junction branch migration DNA helicase RuvB [Candidatus Liptonbacteria bacterium]|nr:Holliday junction branch migration DNA helicase RuvB [Candidatus Liptonbacteria bacterium]